MSLADLIAEAEKRKLARDFSELSDEARRSLVDAMVRIGREASIKARAESMKEARAFLRAIEARAG